MSTSAPQDTPAFQDLSLAPPLLAALESLGYETPSPIQAQTIPLLLQGRDVLGQAQTGTGKTAAFALPALSGLDLSLRAPQVLVLAPTRELAIQVAEAFQRYASQLPGFHVLPIYGGQSYQPQLKGLRRGAHVVVGTPGRVVDHIKHGHLKLDQLRLLVLDEADEMLRMGFIDDVEWVLQQTPASRQIALFSATMPTEIKRVARQHLKDPAEVLVASTTTTASQIRQRYWMVSGSKLDALTRLLETEPFEAMIIFARTKLATAELAEKLEARGFSAAALNGDLDQKQRERIVERLRGGRLDIAVATDVAARGLDVERVTHVINYDIPTDTESYVHRIGRTGRAGRSGEAILFVAPRERRLLAAIERATRQRMSVLELPSQQAVNDRAAQRFEQTLLEYLSESANGARIEPAQQFLESLAERNQVPVARIGAVLAQWLQEAAPNRFPKLGDAGDARRGASRKPDQPLPRPVELAAPSPATEAPRPKRAARDKDDDEEMETFRVEVGHQHGLKPSNLVGAIANEAGLEGRYIGRIDIHEAHSFVDLPVGMPRAIFRDLQKVRVAGQMLRISRADGAPEGGPSKHKGKGKPPKARPRKPG